MVTGPYPLPLRWILAVIFWLQQRIILNIGKNSIDQFHFINTIVSSGTNIKRLTAITGGGLFLACITEIGDGLCRAQILTAMAAIDAAIGVYHFGLLRLFVIDSMAAFTYAGATFDAIFRIYDRIPILCQFIFLPNIYFMNQK